MSKHTEWCAKCDRRVRLSRLAWVEVCRATMSSPAEGEQWCDDCRGPERDDDYERAAARYDGANGERDWR